MLFLHSYRLHVNLKVGMLLFVFMTLFVNGITCQCNPCSEGWYIKRNCSKTKESAVASQCKECEKCNGESQRILVNCTKWSNTVCGCEDGFTPQNSSNLCQKVYATTAPQMDTSDERVWTLTAVFTLLGVVTALALTAWCAGFMQKPAKCHSNTGKSPNMEYVIIKL